MNVKYVKIVLVLQFVVVVVLMVWIQDDVDDDERCGSDKPK